MIVAVYQVQGFVHRDRIHSSAVCCASVSSSICDAIHYLIPTKFYWASVCGCICAAHTHIPCSGQTESKLENIWPDKNATARYVEPGGSYIFHKLCSKIAVEAMSPHRWINIYIRYNYKQFIDHVPSNRTSNDNDQVLVGSAKTYFVAKPTGEAEATLSACMMGSHSNRPFCVCG